MTLIIMGLFATQHNSIECHYGDCLYAECRDFFIVMLSVIMQNVVAPNQAYHAACRYAECRSAECRGALVLSAYPRKKCNERDGKDCGRFNKTESLFFRYKI
jgi:hypothetical protein